MITSTTSISTSNVKIQRRLPAVILPMLLLTLPGIAWSEPATGVALDTLTSSLECDRVPNKTGDFMAARRGLVNRLDAVGSGDPDALVRIYCTVPSWQVDERIFFSHPSFRELSEPDRDFFFLALATLDPAKVLELASAGDRIPSGTYGIATRARARALVERISRLSTQQQLRTYLGEVTGTEKMSRRDQKKLSTERRVRELAADPAIAQNFGQIDVSWFLEIAEAAPTAEPLYRDLAELVQLKVMISRNLRFRSLAVTRDTVAEEYGRILASRQQLGDLSVFGNRRTLYLANEEYWKPNRPVFGSSKTLAALLAQETDLRFATDEATGDADTAELAISEAVETPLLTLVAAGHGRAKGLDLGSGLDSDELARALVDRSAVQGEHEAPVILIAMACKGHDFVRRVLDTMHRLDPSARKPIVIVPAEYGQAFLKYPSEPFVGNDLGLRYEQPSTLGGLFDRAHVATSVYATDENNVPMQIL